MSELVADCPRCGAKQITFDLLSGNHIGTEYRWKQWYEAFCICRRCLHGTIFVLAQQSADDEEAVTKYGLVKLPLAVNRVFNVNHFVSLKDQATVQPPEHLPADIEAAFREGATCLAVACPNAASTMFRLCVDHATRNMLPAEGTIGGPNATQRWKLGARLTWLFDQNLLPEELRDLSHCIKEDGNDGAHAGTLSKADAEDVLDFTTRLLDRLYSEPARLKEAQKRRDARRAEKK